MISVRLCCSSFLHIQFNLLEIMLLKSFFIVRIFEVYYHYCIHFYIFVYSLPFSECIYYWTCPSSCVSAFSYWFILLSDIDFLSAWQEICEDISDHVEQIHALLDTEFSLKLLSYSVNVIVDIHTVQLLWHQLRVSVLVLRERILQGLQDSNGNYTRQTDILQAFTKEEQEARSSTPTLPLTHPN